MVPLQYRYYLFFPFCWSWKTKNLKPEFVFCNNLKTKVLFYFPKSHFNEIKFIYLYQLSTNATVFKKKLRNCSISPQFKNFKYEMPFNCVLNIPLNKCYIKTLVVFVYSPIFICIIYRRKNVWTPYFASYRLVKEY